MSGRAAMRAMQALICAIHAEVPDKPRRLSRRSGVVDGKLLQRRLTLMLRCNRRASAFLPARKRLAAEIKDDLPFLRRIVRKKHGYEIIPERTRKDDKARNARLA
jgi:hypothetical protein